MSNLNVCCYCGMSDGHYPWCMTQQGPAASREEGYRLGAIGSEQDVQFRPKTDHELHVKACAELAEQVKQDKILRIERLCRYAINHKDVDAKARIIARILNICIEGRKDQK